MQSTSALAPISESNAEICLWRKVHTRSPHSCHHQGMPRSAGLMFLRSHFDDVDGNERKSC
jgi:hypothetical protein